MFFRFFFRMFYLEVSVEMFLVKFNLGIVMLKLPWNIAVLGVFLGSILWILRVREVFRDPVVLLIL